MTKEPYKVERAPRPVIENKLMATLAEGRQVAILATEKDLNFFIRALEEYADRLDMPSDTGDRALAYDFVDGMKQLKKGAFGK